MIMAASFAGPSAEQQAHDLVLELRRSSSWKRTRFGGRTTSASRPRAWAIAALAVRGECAISTNSKFDEIAVLVGNFSSIEDPQPREAL